MKLSRAAKAGTLESNDILIMVNPAEDRTITIESPVKEQFGERIEEVIRETLSELEIEGYNVHARDRGALDFCIKARTITAVQRGIER